MPPTATDRETRKPTPEIGLVKHSAAFSLPPPGSERGRAVALEAAGELLVTQGLVAVTIDAVAQRARVDERAISRWWPTEEALGLDVLHHEWLALAEHVRRSITECA
jgi:AcrR family transcriptional regulator